LLRGPPPADRSQRIPTGHARALGDQLEALAEGDRGPQREVRGGPRRRAGRARLEPCSMRPGARVCVADPFVRAKGYEKGHERPR
jgi:hypothetical protein